MLWLVLALLGIAGLLLLLANRKQQAAGLPAGTVIYTDMGERDSAKPLYDATLNLAGKPDYLIRQAGEDIPVEVKTSRTPEQPYESHVLQLAAYAWLVEKTSGKRPPYGVVSYPEKSFKVPYTAALEQQLVAAVQAMRQLENQPLPPACSHNEPRRCRFCGYRSHCDGKLVGGSG